MPDDTPSTPAHSIEATDDELLAIEREAIRVAMDAAHARDNFASSMSRESIVAGLRAVWNAAFDRGRTHTAQPTVNAEAVALVEDVREQAEVGEHNDAGKWLYVSRLNIIYRDLVPRLEAALATPPTPQSPDRDEVYAIYSVEGTSISATPTVIGAALTEESAVEACRDSNSWTEKFYRAIPVLPVATLEGSNHA